MNLPLRVGYEGAALLARAVAAFAPASGGKLLRSFAARRGVRGRYAAFARETERPLLWMHAPSVGELPDRFVFAATDPQHRIELWSIPKGPLLLADAGADYIVNEPSPVTITAAGSSAPPGRSIASYEWDLNYNGTAFDVDHTGLSYTQFFPDGPVRRTVAVRVP